MIPENSENTLESEDPSYEQLLTLVYFLYCRCHSKTQMIHLYCGSLERVFTCKACGAKTDNYFANADSLDHAPNCLAQKLKMMHKLLSTKGVEAFKKYSESNAVST